MREQTLRNFAIFSSSVGLVVLFLISGYIGSENIKIKEIVIGDVGKGVFICGIVEGKRVSNKHIFLDIVDDTGKIKFVMFNSTVKDLIDTDTDPYDIESGDMFCMNGVIDEYPKGSGELELVYRKGKFEKI
ncbi:MAG: hypothetical protein ISS36_00145 [Candidatus Aenigmarchaeota archaeon]|nr:hypothetical protein [Candidatus Aenigmarchaeota archaeon]